jgi:hypothetical protein
MRLISVIDDSGVIEKILRHLQLCCGPARFAPARPPPSTELWEPEPMFHVDPDPMLDDDNVITDRRIRLKLGRCPRAKPGRKTGMKG